MTKLMRTLPVVLLAAAVLSGCSGSLTESEQSYQVPGSITALVVDTPFAAVSVRAGDAPVSVREEYRYSADPPATTHEVIDGTLRLTSTGCGDDESRCEIHYHVELPATARVEITAQAGAIELDGLSGDVQVTTEAGAVEGRGLSSSDVRVKTEAGAITLAFTAAPASVEVTGGLGAVHVEVPGDRAYAVDAAAETGTESVSVRNDQASPNRIAIHTKVGAVEVEPLP